MEPFDWFASLWVRGVVLGMVLHIFAWVSAMYRRADFWSRD